MVDCSDIPSWHSDLGAHRTDPENATRAGTTEDTMTTDDLERLQEEACTDRPGLEDERVPAAARMTIS